MSAYKIYPYRWADSTYEVRHYSGLDTYRVLAADIPLRWARRLVKSKARHGR